MPDRVNIRRLSVTMIIIMAMIAVALPLCQMIDCNMLMGTMSHHMGASLSRACDFASSTTAGPIGVVPPGSESLLLSLAALLGVAFVVLHPPREVRLVRVIAEDPPPPPEDPRGARLII